MRLDVTYCCLGSLNHFFTAKQDLPALAADLPPEYGTAQSCQQKSAHFMLNQWLL